jgi:hypothetical protein
MIRDRIDGQTERLEKLDQTVPSSERDAGLIAGVRATLFTRLQLGRRGVSRVVQRC